MDMEISHFNLMKENTNPNTYDSLLDSPAKEQYKAKIAESLFQESAAQLTRDAKVRYLRYYKKSWTIVYELVLDIYWWFFTIIVVCL